MNQPNMPVVPSASGYPNYSFLTDPIFSKSLISRFKAKAVTSQFTTNGSSEVPSQIKDTGSEVILRRAPEAEIKSYQKNQGLTHSKLTSDLYRLTIDRAKYWSLKLNYIDTKQIQGVNTWINEWKSDAVSKMDLEIGREILIQVPWEVSPFNKGSCAGKRTGQYDMGTSGKPVVLTPSNIAEKLAEAQAVLAEQNVTGPYIIVAPYAMKPMMYRPESPLYSVCVSGESKAIFLQNGEYWPTMVGFSFIFTHETPQYRDPDTGKTTYTLLIGRKDAILLVTQITYNRVIDSNADDFATFWQGLQVYGFKLIRPEAMAVMYVTFG